MSIINLGKIANPEEFQKYINESEKLETVLHKYGGKFEIPDYPCWMQYSVKLNPNGNISFTRNTMKNPVLAEMVEKVIHILDNIFINGLKPLPQRVHFLRTVGNILPHTDESDRKTCINIGIKNSNSAVTKIHNDDGSVTALNIKEGYAYLLNTNQVHSVEGTTDYRYLITYGFEKSFTDIQDYLLIPKN